MAGKNGFGAQLVFATSAWTGAIVEISRSGASRKAIDVTHHGSTAPSSDPAQLQDGGMEFMAGLLRDGGELKVKVLYDPGNPPPVTAREETITLKYPLFSGQVLPARRSGSGFITSDEEEVPVDDKMSMDLTIKLSGVWTLTPATTA